MNKKNGMIAYSIVFAVFGLIVGPIVGWNAAFLWADYHLKHTGFSAGNAPPFFFAFGLFVGPILGALIGRQIYKISHSSE